ncbi:MAG: S-layer homology domain-containing protein [Moorellales bacterium]
MSDPWSGNWLWLWRMDAVGADPNDLAAEAKKLGVTGVIVKAHDGSIGGSWMKQLRELAGPLRDAGLEVAAWGYLYGLYPEIEAATAAKAIKSGASFYVADAEAEFERPGMDEAAALFFFHLYQEVPEAVVGFTSFAVTNLHPKFPWSTFANHCRFAMPQVYWREIGWKPDVCWSRSYASYVGLVRPIVPVLQAFGGVDPNEMLEVAELAKRYGCPGVSWWSWQHAGSSQLNAVKEAGRLFGVGKDYAGRWSEKAIERAKQLGIMSDYADGTFRPTQALTREEAAALTVKLWNEIMEQVSGCLSQVAKRMQEIAGALGGVAGVEGEAAEADGGGGVEAGR